MATAAMKAWDIYSRDGHFVDTVFFIKSMSAQEVKTSLIEHDGYLPIIEVVEG